ncbi:MAG TPA: MarR family winged helix-turn-helix transcriptional regulator [Streptosporangiaceae bacterium]
MRRLTSGGPANPDLREPYLHICGNLGVDGIRLIDLAARAQLSPATACELVGDLQALGYLERPADGTNKRAKLIFPIPRGRQAFDDAGDRVAQIGEHGRRSSDRSASPTPAAPEGNEFCLCRP